MNVNTNLNHAKNAPMSTGNANRPNKERTQSQICSFRVCGTYRRWHQLHLSSLIKFCPLRLHQFLVGLFFVLEYIRATGAQPSPASDQDPTTVMAVHATECLFITGLFELLQALLERYEFFLLPWSLTPGYGFFELLIQTSPLILHPTL